MKGIRIIAKVDGIRRAGRSHVGTADYPAATFTAAELAALKAEPKLVITEIDLPDPAETKAAK